MATHIETPRLPRQSDTFRHGRRRNKLVRRSAPEHSQAARRSFQIAFLLLNLYLGATFYFWVRQFEGGRRMVSERPPGVEGWLPIAGMMNFKYWLVTGSVPRVHPAAMLLLLSFVAISVFFRKAFCSWLCPMGTISESLAALGRRIFGRNLRIRKWVDLPLRALKYLLLGFFVWAVASMSAPELDAFMHSPYALIADVKMLNFFRHLDQTRILVIGILVIASALVENFWCRYLCPYGALLGLASIFSPIRIRRTPSACIDCAKCARACPSNLAVDRLVSIRSAECTGCIKCVRACPAEGALGMHFGHILVPTWVVAVGIALVFGGVVGYAKASQHWRTHISPSFYQELIPAADQVSHPMPGDASLK
jgi:polyferredoxin